MIQLEMVREQPSNHPEVQNFFRDFSCAKSLLIPVKTSLLVIKAMGAGRNQCCIPTGQCIWQIKALKGPLLRSSAIKWDSTKRDHFLRLMFEIHHIFPLSCSIRSYATPSAYVFASISFIASLQTLKKVITFKSSSADDVLLVHTTVTGHSYNSHAK